MKIRQILIAVFVSFLVNINIAEAVPAKATKKVQLHSWQRMWHGKIYNFLGKKWRLNWRYRAVASPAVKTAPLAPVAPKAPTIASALPKFTASPTNRDHEPKAPASNSYQGSKSPTIAKAPEISAASGASALAFLSGVMLLIGERTRQRKI